MRKNQIATNCQYSVLVVNRFWNLVEFVQQLSYRIAFDFDVIKEKRSKKQEKRNSDDY